MARMNAPRTDTAGTGRKPGRFRHPALLLRDESGNAIIEYAIVGPMFIALLIATINTALIFLTQSAVESAAEGASRLVMTGQAQNWGYAPSGSGYTQYNSNNGMKLADLKAAICGQINAAYLPGGADPNNTGTYSASMILPYMNCNNLYINVQTAASFAATSTGTHGTNGAVDSVTSIAGVLNADGTVNTAQLQSNYSLGTGGNIEFVQVIYLWPTTTGPLGVDFITQQNTHNRYIVATSVLTTENYSTPST